MYTNLRLSQINFTETGSFTGSFSGSFTGGGISKTYTFGGTGTPTVANDVAPWIRINENCLAISGSLTSKTAPTANFRMTIKKSADSGSTFPTEVVTVTVSSGSYVGLAPSGVSLSAGDLLRLDILSVNGGADWNCQLNAKTI